jgi:hypothetical protein
MDKLVRCLTALPVAAAVMISPNAASVAWTPAASSAPFDPPEPPATIFEVGGAGWETIPENVMKALLGFRYNGGSFEPGNGNTFVNIEWPAYLGTLGESVKQASDDLYAVIGTTDGPEVAAGLSGSTFVINEVMRRLTNDPTPPAGPDKITFVVVGDGERGLLPAIAALIGPNLPLVNYTVQPIPVTPYDMIVVSGEYDGLSDWPDRPWNLLAVANAWLGSPAVEGYGEIHWDSILNSLDAVPAKNITTEVNAKGGTTVTYLVPTPEIPLLYPLHAMGVPQAAIDVLNSVLKPLVDLGYSRNDPTWLKNLTGAASSVAAPRPSAATPAAEQRALAPVSASAPVSESDLTVDARNEELSTDTADSPSEPSLRDQQSPAASAAVGKAPARSAAKRVAATATTAPAAKPAETRRAARVRAGAAATR